MYLLVSGKLILNGTALFWFAVLIKRSSSQFFFYSLTHTHLHTSHPTQSPEANLWSTRLPHLLANPQNYDLSQGERPREGRSFMSHFSFHRRGQMGWWQTSILPPGVTHYTSGETQWHAELPDPSRQLITGLFMSCILHFLLFLPFFVPQKWKCEMSMFDISMMSSQPWHTSSRSSLLPIQGFINLLFF